MSFELSKEDEMRANAAAGSVLAMLFRGAATVFSAVGTGTKFVTDNTATGLRFAADAVEGSGDIVNDFCQERAASCEETALEYSGFSPEDIAMAKQVAEDAAEVVEGSADSEKKFKPQPVGGREGRAPMVEAELVDVV